MVELYRSKRGPLARLLAFTGLILLIFNTRVLAQVGLEKRVFDQAGLLSQEEVQDLEEDLDRYSRRRKTEIVILTSAEGDPQGHRAFNEDFYSSNFEEGTPLILLSVNTKTRDLSVLAFAESQARMDDSRCRLLREKVTPKLSQGHYYQAFKDYGSLGSRYLSIRSGISPNSIFFNNFILLFLAFFLALGSILYMLRQVGGSLTVDDRTYRDFQNTRILNKRDRYIRTSVTRTRIETDNRSGGGGGSSSSGGTTSGGTSYSGSSGKF